MKYHGWAIVEIMGHRRRVGLVSEESIAGVTMLRIEVPVAGKLEETRPEFYPGTSIFGMRPISAEEAAAELAPRPWEVKQLPAPPVPKADEEDGYTLLLGDVLVEHQEAMAGWALITGCGGDAPVMAGFFPYPCGKTLAERMLAAKDADGEPWVFDGEVVPAFATDDGGMFVANHHDDRAAVAALAEHFGRASKKWGDAFESLVAEPPDSVPPAEPTEDDIPY